MGQRRGVRCSVLVRCGLVLIPLSRRVFGSRYEALVNPNPRNAAPSCERGKAAPLANRACFFRPALPREASVDELEGTRRSIRWN